MNWAATVYPVSKVEGDWATVPSAVLWVDITRDGRTMTLRGADWYWVEGERFGIYFDPHPTRPHASDRAWAWPEHGMFEIPVPSRESVRVKAGVEIPDDEWDRLVH